jgi:hypothetical protein
MIVAGEFGPLPALVSPWMEEGSLVHYLERKFPGMSEPRKRELVSGKWLSHQLILSYDFRYGRLLLVLVIVRYIVNNCRNRTIC